ncbi:ultraviolet-B receptor UVR8 isoform X2 [Jatropha curcas]|uniref:ultraviolet-B receptor UVR8 isoform X2 n=1 Tax=Jatropha curcas TaxID=180498 RepID=UPI0009D77403|nr:ultraviolet-B receptor UVR8 isoform X2 [Jatropha curcas]
MIVRSRSLTQIGRYSKYKRWMSSVSTRKYAAVWGNGDFGRLGLGCLDSQWRPKLLRTSSFSNQDLKSIACGGAHTLFLTEEGHVYAAGLNDFGQLGVSGNDTYIMKPIEVSGLEKEIIQISAGYHHSCAITVDGELYMWGRNSNGQLGLGKKAKGAVPLPTKVECLNGLTIKKAALASEHSIAVTDEGETLSWGRGGCGQLGHGNHSSILGFLRSSSEYTPRRIKKLEGVKVKNVAAGLLHSVCIDANGSVFVFGEKAADKFGFGNVNDAATPSIVDELPCSEEVACGGYHTCVVTSGGELYAWGDNENGCLGIGSTNAFHLPERVQGHLLRSPIDKVSCGWKHTAAISGNIYTWGWGGSNGTFSEDGHSSGGQLGHGSDVDCANPTLVSFEKNVKPLQVSCGFNHTGAIVETVEF